MKSLRKIVFAITVAFMSSASLAHGSEADRIECYGTTLTVSMPVEMRGSLESERVLFELPYPSSWYMDVEGFGELSDLACMKEPLNTRRVSGVFIEPKLGHGEIQTSDVKNAKLVKIHLVSSTSNRFESRELKLNTIILDDGVLTNDGFVRLKGTNTDKVGGEWLFPDTYKSPVGSRIRMRCALRCSVYYRIRSGLQLNYEFRVADKNAELSFIEIDKYVRDLVFSWIREE